MLSLCWLKLWFWGENTNFSPSIPSFHISLPVLISDSVHLALVYGVSRASAAFQNKALFNLIIYGSIVPRRSAQPENALSPQQNAGNYVVVSQPLPRSPAKHLASAFSVACFQLRKHFGIFHGEESHLAHFIINYHKARLRQVCKSWISLLKIKSDCSPCCIRSWPNINKIIILSKHVCSRWNLYYYKPIIKIWQVKNIHSKYKLTFTCNFLQFTFGL